MTALTVDRKTDQIHPNGKPTLMSIPVAASTKIYGGSIVATDANGRAVPASATGTLKVVGIADRVADNSSGAAAAINVTVRLIAAYVNNGTGANAIAQANLLSLCYASDDNTVNLTDNGGAWPVAGYVADVRSDGQIGVVFGTASLYNEPVSAGTQPGSTVRRARNVINGAVTLSSYTVASNAAVNDAVLNVAGDIVLCVKQATAAQNGPYVVGTVTTGTAPLTRPDWWQNGQAFATGAIIEVGGEGTLFNNTTWKATAAAGTINTNDPAFYPKCVVTSVVLVAGTTAALTTIPVLSATRTAIAIQRTTVNTCAATVMYSIVPAPTPGIIGTASIVPMAVVAAGTLNNADISTLSLSVTNW